MTDKFAPCIYTALTTMVAFASLTTSEIVPVMDFGWTMCAGILLLFSGGNSAITVFHAPALTRFFAGLSLRHTSLILGIAASSCVFAGIGICRISLDDRFIDHFRSGTEIHKGLTYIDTVIVTWSDEMAQSKEDFQR